jgi:hypothetical protein
MSAMSNAYSSCCNARKRVPEEENQKKLARILGTFCLFEKACEDSGKESYVNGGERKPR